MEVLIFRSLASTIVKLELFEGLQGIAKPSDSKCLASVVTTSGQVAIALISENEASEQQQHQGRMGESIEIRYREFS